MEWTLAQIIVLGLAVARVSSLIVHDDIIEPVRHLLFSWSPPADPEHYRVRELPDGTPFLREPGFLGRLVSCYHCVGVWVAGLSYSAVASLPEVAWPILTVAAIAQISDTAIKVSREW